jgi:hypothetical protein
LRIRVGETSALRIAWGRYHQAPSPLYFDFGRGASRLPPMAAMHRIVGFELGDASTSAFLRVEAYTKSYASLPLDDEANGFSGTGYGSARGIDLFAHRAWPWLDLQLTASMLDAKRRWTASDQQDRYPLPPGAWRPDFSIPYSWHLVASRSIARTVSIAGGWRVAAGRPFTPALGAELTPDGYVPIWASINSDRLPHYERIDLSASMLRPLGAKAVAVFFASVDNLTGRRNFFEYAYSADYRARHPVVTAAPRSFYVGCSITR